MTAKRALEVERDERMKPNLPWFTGEPLLRLPFDAVLIDREKQCVYVTLKDVAASL